MAHCLTQDAERDLAHIWDYVARESSPDRAELLITSILARLLLLARYPQLGRRRDDDLRLGLRSFATGVYVIIYRIEASDVVILRVIHGRRDIPPLLGDQ